MLLYLTQAQVYGRRFRDVHDFAVGRHDENETVQGLSEREKTYNRLLLVVPTPAAAVQMKLNTFCWG